MSERPPDDVLTVDEILCVDYETRAARWADLVRDADLVDVRGSEYVPAGQAYAMTQLAPLLTPPRYDLTRRVLVVCHVDRLGEVRRAVRDLRRRTE